jgi:CRP/FNR family cyclic AMP-dependent transcriptional regulator
MTTELLRDVALFKDLSDAELDAMKDIWSFRHAAARERIVAEGEPMHELFIVAAGVVHVRRVADGHEVLLGRILRGGVFGEMNLFSEGPATASVYAMEEVRLAVTSDATLREFMGARPDIGYKITTILLGDVCARLRQTNDRLVHSMFWGKQ